MADTGDTSDQEDGMTLGEIARAFVDTLNENLSKITHPANKAAQEKPDQQA